MVPFHCGPSHLAEIRPDFVENVAHESAEMEILGTKSLFPVVGVQPVRHLHFVGVLSVNPHENEEDHKKAKQAADIGKSCVQFCVVSD